MANNTTKKAGSNKSFIDRMGRSEEHTSELQTRIDHE